MEIISGEKILTYEPNVGLKETRTGLKEPNAGSKEPNAGPKAIKEPKEIKEPKVIKEPLAIKEPNSKALKEPKVGQKEIKVGLKKPNTHLSIEIVTHISFIISIIQLNITIIKSLTHLTVKWFLGSVQKLHNVDHDWGGDQVLPPDLGRVHHHLSVQRSCLARSMLSLSRLQWKLRR